MRVTRGGKSTSSPSKWRYFQDPLPPLNVAASLKQLHQASASSSTIPATAVPSSTSSTSSRSSFASLGLTSLTPSSDNSASYEETRFLALSPSPQSDFLAHSTWANARNTLESQIALVRQQVEKDKGNEDLWLLFARLYRRMEERAGTAAEKVRMWREGGGRGRMEGGGRCVVVALKLHQLAEWDANRVHCHRDRPHTIEPT